MRVRHLALVAAAFGAVAACSPPTGGPQVATAGSHAPDAGRLRPAAAAEVHEVGEQRQQFLSCMRELGVELVDPGGERRVPVTTGPEAERAQAALEQCRAYLPGGGLPPRPSQDDVERARAYAKCVRENGVPYYPDPDPETGRPPLTTELGDRIKHDPRMVAADERCRNDMPRADAGGANG